ncbi:MAG: hypothetical protein R3E97_19340 [Candidatus Eisenbacteria bacterium]
MRIHRTGRPPLLLAGGLFLAAQLGAGIGCSDDDEGPEPDPTFPGQTPTTASMQIDLSELNDSGSPATFGPCHSTSFLLVTIANGFVATALILPIATLGATVQNEPVYVGDQTWRWSASGGSGGGAWTADFEGHLASATVVEWTMIVNGTDLDLEDFVWYTGVSNLAASSGSWTFYDPWDLDEVGETLYSTYVVQSEDVGNLTFENRNDDGDGFGDLLTYDANDDDLAVSFYDASEDGTLSVAWSKSSGVGQLTTIQGETCCWGERPTYPDVQCPL